MPLLEFWSQLDGPVHPKDQRFFRERPDVEALFQTNFIPSAFFGDVGNAKVILCYGNGGSEDDQAFYRQPALQKEYLDHIRNPGPFDPARFFTYFDDEWHTPLIRDGVAALVNAVAYRSTNMNDLKESKVRDIPSVRAAREWIRGVVEEAKAGRRLVVFQRSRLWGSRRDRAVWRGFRGVVFANNPVSPHLSEATRRRIAGYLARSS